MNDTRAYWEQRLGADWSLTGVGFSRLGGRFNAWQYRLRDERFTQTVAQLGLDVQDARVLDVGSGTGFYLEAWTRLGAREVVGMDLTAAAVTNLRTAFPKLTVFRGDISEGDQQLSRESFDVVSCMDVMFHIVDHARFATALANIADLLVPGGFFVWSDFFVHGRETTAGHITYRSLGHVTRALDEAGLEIVSRAPLFYLMNEPRDVRTSFALRAWMAVIWLSTRSERVADVVGRALYRLDRRLVTREESPSTEIMVCRKRVH